MQRPELKDFENPATPYKRKSHKWKQFTGALLRYIAFLEGVISGKNLTIPKEQLPIHCPKCLKVKESLKESQALISEAYDIVENVLTL